ncbi:MAG TPA: hypothetical protein VMW31_00220, partial [Devosiaceae bacterium]|nr:hypothetical protein [Devosiaceae bacterium]
MKSLSTIGARAGVKPIGEAAAAAAPRASAALCDPLSGFTNFQWFVFRARNTVFYSAYSAHRYDAETLAALVGHIVSLAPQLTHGFIGARPGEPLPAHLVDAVTSIAQVDGFEDFPEAALTPGLDIYDRPDLPLFRVEAAVRRDGPDGEGRQSAILVRSSHAVMEGSDSALLNRSRYSGHGVSEPPAVRVPWYEKAGYRAIAAFMAPLHLVAAHFLSPGETDFRFMTALCDRNAVRIAASR